MVAIDSITTADNRVVVRGQRVFVSDPLIARFPHCFVDADTPEREWPTPQVLAIRRQEAQG
jgi:hypothetical protein